MLSNRKKHQKNIPNLKGLTSNPSSNSIQTTSYEPYSTVLCKIEYGFPNSSSVNLYLELLKPFLWRLSRETLISFKLFNNDTLLSLWKLWKWSKNFRNSFLLFDFADWNSDKLMLTVTGTAYTLHFKTPVTKVYPLTRLIWS